MRAHGHAGEDEKLRSRLTELIREGLLLRGTLTLRKRRCGKARCRCARGHLHASWYLVQTDRGRLLQRAIPKTLVTLVREACERHREIRKLIDALSQIAWRRLEAAKRQPEAKGRAGNRRKAGLTPEGERPYNEGVV